MGEPEYIVFWDGAPDETIRFTRVDMTKSEGELVLLAAKLVGQSPSELIQEVVVAYARQEVEG